MGGVETDLIYPRNMPDLFKGTQITLIGRYSNERDLENVRLRLTGKTGRETRTFAYEQLQFPLRESENDFLPRLWATRRVGWLMEQIRTNGEQKELRDEIVDLGTRYGIVTPYTSYLAVEPNMAAQPMPDDMSAATGGDRGNVSNLRTERADKDNKSGGFGALAPPPAAKEAAKATTGMAAVQQSKRDRQQQESTIVKNEDTSSAVRKVGDKTFYLVQGVWTDAESRYVKMAETALTFGSDEYFALLKREPRLAQYFALGERVLVVFDGHLYRVNAAP
jgi:Ca-activated chloride channel family protein